VVLDKPDETVDVVIFFEVNGQYVTQWPSLLAYPSRRISNVYC
jgi:hypothetical protein